MKRIFTLHFVDDAKFVILELYPIYFIQCMNAPWCLKMSHLVNVIIIIIIIINNCEHDIREEWI